MSIASVPTKLPLATFAKILGIHPLHFEGIAFTPTDRSPNICDEALLQYAWQESDRTGRDEIGRAIADAEEMIEQHLKFRLLPVWEADEWRMTTRPNNPEFFAFGIRDVRGHSPVVKSKWGNFVTGGIEAKTLISAGANIAWSDSSDSDSREDTGTVVVAVAAAVQECEVEIYYPGHDGEPEYQIRPITVVIAAGNATITFKRELCVIEDIMESLDPRPANYATDADFLEEVDVYRHYNDPATQVTLMWEPFAGCESCVQVGCQNCAYDVQTGCLHLRSEPKDGMLGFSPGTYDAVTSTFSLVPYGIGRQPDIARLYYRAGNTSPRGCSMVMEPKWARIVTYLAASLIDRPLCSCADQTMAYWREDMALLSGGEGSQNSTYSFDTRKAAGENGFGTRRGALYAWNRVAKDPGVARVDSATW